MHFYICFGIKPARDGDLLKQAFLLNKLSTVV